MQYLILGSFEVRGEAGRVAIPAAKQRALLAILLTHAGSAVPGWRLVEDLWEVPPVSARKVVQTYVSKLRQVLPPSALITTQTGYQLDVARDALDSTRFEDLLRDAASLPTSHQLPVLREALALWRGDALEDFAEEPFAQAERARLGAMRQAALERRVDLELSENRHDSILGELVALVQANPLNERTRAQLMLALYRSGRQDDALRVFRDGRRALVDQLGVEPTPELCRLEEAILRHDPALAVSTSELPQVAATDLDPRRATTRDSSSTKGFVGRVDDVTGLRALLLEDRERWVTLTGPAGIGKSRLAVEVARRVAQDYRDGWVFVDLTRVDHPGGVGSELCRALGVLLDDPAHAESALAAVLGARQQLLVLDNFEHVLDAAPLVQLLLERAPGITVVVTSRSALRHLPELEYPVPPLGVPDADADWDALIDADAVALFVERARAARPDFTLTEAMAPEVAQLCAQLDGLPLAIELAAARVDMLSPRAVLTRLDQRLDLLATDRPETPERHRSLRTAVDWSYDLLDDDSKSLLADLSVFRGGFTVDTAEHVVSPVSGLLVDVVRKLVDASLLHPAGAAGEEPRVSMLETIREYAAERLAESGRVESLRDAHARAYRDLAEEAETQLRGPDQVRWLDLLQAELPNVRESVGWSGSHGDPDRAVLIMARLWRFWQVRGLTHEARARFEELLAGPDLSESARAAGHLGAAQCAFHQGDLAVVTHHVDSCLPHYRADHDLFSVCFALMILGAATGRAGDTAGGAALLREALDLAKASGDDWMQSTCRGYLGMVLSARREYQPARLALEEGLRGCRELGDTRLVGWFLIGLGRAALGAGDAPYAHRRFEEALVWERAMHDAWAEAWVLQGLACTALAERDLESALDHATESVRPAREAYSPAAVAGALGILATVAHECGSDPVAAELLGAGALLSGPSPLWGLGVDGVTLVDEDALVRSIGASSFAEHAARGRALTIDDAVALAATALTR